MAYIGNDLQVAYPTYKNIDDISGSFNSSTTSFPLLVNGVAPVPPPLNSQQCLISVGGVVQRPDDSGTEGFRLSGGNIIFASAPTTGADFFGVILAGADYVNAGGTFPSGSAAVPSITFNGDPDTGIYNPGANELSFTTSGTERFKIGASGQFGIGGSTYGASGQVLTSSGSGSAPTWTTPLQLTDSVNSTSTTTAATPNSVKTTYDLANAALPKAGGTLTGDVTLNAQSDLRFADADSSNWVAFQAPTTVSSNVTWTLPATDGTANQVLSTNGSGALSWATASGSNANYQEFTSNGTWTKPAGATFVYVVAIGGGGGGGSGSRYPTTSNRNGGTGGASGLRAEGFFQASDLGSTETVTVGSGGTGGPSATTNSSTGSNGGSGGESIFGSILRTGTAGGGNAGSVSSNINGGAVTTRGIGVSAVAGANITTYTPAAGSNTPYFGGAGAGAGRGANVTTAQSGSTGGIVGFSNQTAVTAAETSASFPGGGGGGGSYTTGQAGGSGGNGAFPGGGGGGGGAADDGFASGAGGSGGGGVVRVWSW